MILSCVTREKSPRFAEPLKRKVQWTLRAAKTFARLDRANDISYLALREV